MTGFDSTQMMVSQGVTPMRMCYSLTMALRNPVPFIGSSNVIVDFFVLIMGGNPSNAPSLEITTKPEVLKHEQSSSIDLAGTLDVHSLIRTP